MKTESNEPRSYIIQTDSGEIRRNRRHLVKIPESVKDNDKITSETAPDNSSKSDNENKDIPDNLSDHTDYYVTKSGRISKPPDKLNLQTTSAVSFKKHISACLKGSRCNVICFLYSSTSIHFPTVLILMYYFSVSP